MSDKPRVDETGCTIVSSGDQLHELIRFVRQVEDKYEEGHDVNEALVELVSESDWRTLGNVMVAARRVDVLAVQERTARVRQDDERRDALTPDQFTNQDAGELRAQEAALRLQGGTDAQQ